MYKSQLSDNSVSICQSNSGEVNLIKDLLSLANLTVNGVEQNVRNFLSLYYNESLIGTIGLEIYDNNALLRSLAIDKQYQNRGFGKMLCSEIINKAQIKNIKKLYLLTETAEKFFESLGFEKIPRESADDLVKTSEEFSSICPSTAICMQLTLD
ncbi:MAG: arsenic resistance N-acetyltransferase ArsN2 [Ignavibacteria bacterium]|jgi:amino-acid N-acetyltransferase